MNRLKTILTFDLSSDGTQKANDWLKDRDNDVYETEISFTGGDYAAIHIVYWLKKHILLEGEE